MADERTNKPITIYDIAAEAKVSPSTVSRVLTGSANVRKPKKDRVLALIEKYNFKPNALAKGLSDTHSKLIGFITADVRNPFYSAVYVACETAAHERGYRIILFNSLGEKEREIEELDMLMQQRVDAIIQLGGGADDLVTDANFAKAAGNIVRSIPMVVNGKIDGVDCFTVRIDAKAACRMLMEHLLELGHRDIALVGGRLDVVSTNEKYQAYKTILQFSSIEYRDDYIVTGGYDQEAGYEGVKKLLKLDKMPTAIIAINDFSACGVIKGLYEAGLRVPQDVSVVSYDNTYITELLTPRLTSIDYDYAKLGEAFVDAAVAAAEGVDTPKCRTITPKLYVRDSAMKI